VAVATLPELPTHFSEESPVRGVKVHIALDQVRVASNGWISSLSSSCCCNLQSVPITPSSNAAPQNTSPSDVGDSGPLPKGVLLNDIDVTVRAGQFVACISFTSPSVDRLLMSGLVVAVVAAARR
jgi:hypothetical protein